MGKRRLLIKFVFNKYFILFMVFMIWVVFLDECSVMTQINYLREISRMKKQNSVYNELINKMESEISKIEKDKIYLKHLAISSYFYRHKGADIFVIHKKKKH